MLFIIETSYTQDPQLAGAHRNYRVHLKVSMLGSQYAPNDSDVNMQTTNRIFVIWHQIDRYQIKDGDHKQTKNNKQQQSKQEQIIYSHRHHCPSCQ